MHRQDSAMAIQTSWRPEETSLEKIGDFLDVPRETQEKLDCYVQLLIKWQARINLISSKTLPEIWHRHILDSAQLVSYLPKTPSVILDMGSGAGLPGVILAILTCHQLHLVESDSRKIAFMRTALRETGTSAILHEQRMETVPALRPDIITARALAPLSQLLTLASGQHHEKIEYLFLKGREAKQELTALPACPKMEAECLPSMTDSQASIIRLKPILYQ
ncbi:MAG: 16S rRNA (guanine(527)-N(7))-methyltransferase RsmG [Proteobacteria bacterium]|nr:16S rRNA (guanine(527)-N(7))-methyltransferase RsmG [Pseudomonadota bacterium]